MSDLHGSPAPDTKPERAPRPEYDLDVHEWRVLLPLLPVGRFAT